MRHSSRVFLLLLVFAVLFAGAVLTACDDDDDDDDDDDSAPDNPTDDDDDDDDNDSSGDDDDDTTGDDDIADDDVTDDDTTGDDDDDDDDDDDNDDDDDDFIVWHKEFDAGIAQGVAISDSTDEVWVAVQLNEEGLYHFAATGDGNYDFFDDLLTFGAEASFVAAAESVSLGVVAVQTVGNPVTVRAFNSTNTTTPLWTYDFPTEYIYASPAIDVSADGSLVIVSATAATKNAGYLVTLDGSDGSVVHNEALASSIAFAELSEDGTRALLTEGDTGNIIATSDFSSLHTFSVVGAGADFRLARNGQAAIAGGFDAKAVVETAKGWETAWTESESSQWYGALAVSGDGETAFAVSRDYSNNLDLTYRVIDLTSGTELGRSTTSGTGGFQDSPQRAQVSDDGTVFVVVSWGLEHNEHPEVQILDRTGSIIGGLDTPGSPFDVDLTADGRYLVSGGKGVHANTQGNGGDVYVCDIDTLAR